LTDPTATPPAPTDDQTTSSTVGLVDWDDPGFKPEVSQYGSGDYIKMFQMHPSWPEKPFEDRKFQLGGKERVAILEGQVSVYYAHRLNKRYMGSAVNGTRRCSLDERGSCPLCEHYENAPSIEKDGRKQKQARCGRRQQIFGVNLLVYKTDLEGKLVTEDGANHILLDPEKGPVLVDPATGQPTANPAELCYDVYLWRFNAEKFQDIREIKAEFDLKQTDLIFALAANKDPKFQDFSPTPSPRCAWRMSALGPAGKEAAAKIIEYYKENKYDVEAILGKMYDENEMIGFLGTGLQQVVGAAPAMPGQPAPVDPAARPTADIATQIEEEIAAIDGGSPATPPAQAPPATPPAQAPPATPPASQPAPAVPPAATPPATPPADETATPPATPPADPQPVQAAPSDFDQLLEG
jgi:hypothetical protein